MWFTLRVRTVKRCERSYCFTERNLMKRDWSQGSECVYYNTWSVTLLIVDEMMKLIGRWWECERVNTLKAEQCRCVYWVDVRWADIATDRLQIKTAGKLMWACVEEWKAGWENKLTTGLMFSLELRLNETLIWLRQAYLIYSKLKAPCGSSCFLSPSFPSSSQPTDSLVLSTPRTPCGLLWQNISTSTAMTFGTKIHVPPGCIVISLLIVQSSWRISKATHFDEVHSWSWK